MTLFAVSNFIAFIYAIITLLSSDFSVSKLFYLVLILIIGIACTVYATYRTYQFVIIATMEVLYKNLSSFFEKISELIIDKVEHLLKGTNRLSSEKLKSALDLRKMINSRYQKAPSFLKKGIILILNRIPFAAMLLDLQDDILNGKKVEASKKLYIKMDDFISNILFGNNNTKWIYWLLPLNIFAVILLIKFKIG